MHLKDGKQLGSNLPIHMVSVHFYFSSILSLCLTKMRHQLKTEINTSSHPTHTDTHTHTHTQMNPSQILLFHFSCYFILPVHVFCHYSIALHKHHHLGEQLFLDHVFLQVHFFHLHIPDSHDHVDRKL